jgi:hypothetical protein
MPRPEFRIDAILEWADAWLLRIGAWPTLTSGPIPEALGDTWRRVDRALRGGYRGMPGGSSLARLLDERRGVRNLSNLPPLTEAVILAWADAYHERHGGWPNAESGPVAGTRGETWHAVDAALGLGVRGLPGGSSLARLLEGRRGVRNPAHLPALAVPAILAWADAHKARTGRWPKSEDGAVAGAPGETWQGVNHALRYGRRGLPGGMSLGALLAAERGHRPKGAFPPLSRRLILAWAARHRQRTGRWPTSKSGTVTDAPEEDWKGIDEALRSGFRGLKGGSSLAKLLAARRGVPNRAAKPRLTERQILAWARQHRRRTGRWPSENAGAIPGSGGLNWMAVNSALRDGWRGLPGGSSLSQLLRGVKG